MEQITLSSSFGDFFLFTEDYVNYQKGNAQVVPLPEFCLQKLKLTSNSVEELSFIWFDRELKLVGLVIKRNGTTKIKYFDRGKIEGLHLTYEKPAKGGGIVNIGLQMGGSEKSFFYGYVNVKRIACGSWDYSDWEQQVEYFERNILNKLLEFCDCEIVSGRQYVNC
ncbi:MAG: hypothetical protein ACEPOZ_17680 [Marinifilaceae bacterium]